MAFTRCLHGSRKSTALALALALVLPACGGSTDGRSRSGGTAGAAGSAGADGGELLALSYNVAGLPALLSGSEPEINVPLISPLLNDYDLVLVQEDWLTPDPNPIPSARVYHDLLAADADHAYQSVPQPVPLGEDPRRPSALLSDGLNEFSRFPFDEPTHVAWTGCFGGTDTSDGGAADCLALKGFSVALHQLSPGVQVDVYDLHAEAGATAEDDRLNALDFEELAAFIEQRSAGRALIVGGDTNLGAGDTAVWQAFLDRVGLEDACHAVACSEPDELDKFAFRSSDDVSLEALSHHFERDAFVREDGAPLSDHDPLAVRFRWVLR